MSNIQKLIKEQFNISNMDFGNSKTKRNHNIFNKDITNPYDIYKKIINREKITRNSVDDLNIMEAVIKPVNCNDLRLITSYYS